MYIVPEDHHAALVLATTAYSAKRLRPGEVVGRKRQAPPKRKLVIEEFAFECDSRKAGTDASTPIPLPVLNVLSRYRILVDGDKSGTDVKSRIWQRIAIDQHIAIFGESIR